MNKIQASSMCSQIESRPQTKGSLAGLNYSYVGLRRKLSWANGTLTIAKQIFILYVPTAKNNYYFIELELSKKNKDNSIETGIFMTYTCI